MGRLRAGACQHFADQVADHEGQTALRCEILVMRQQLYEGEKREAAIKAHDGHEPTKIRFPRGSEGSNPSLGTSRPSKNARWCRSSGELTLHRINALRNTVWRLSPLRSMLNVTSAGIFEACGGSPRSRRVYPLRPT